MAPAIAKSVKTDLKGRLKLFRERYARAFRAFTPAELGERLTMLGLVRGDIVLVHSSFDAFMGFVGKPMDVIRTLQQAVGPEGAVLMPTLPFTGTAVDYARNRPLFDVVRTPSRMGLLTELFRRSEGVVRSVHPTHPVAIWARDAQPIADVHFQAATPCGKGSPFAMLLDRDGKILLLGTDIDSLTFYHMIEESIEPRLPFSPFTQERFALVSKRRDGSLVTTDTRLFEPTVSRRRNLRKLVPELKRRGAWREARLGGLEVTLLNARDVFAAVEALLERGVYCYD